MKVLRTKCTSFQTWQCPAVTFFQCSYSSAQAQTGERPGSWPPPPGRCPCGLQGQGNTLERPSHSTRGGFPGPGGPFLGWPSSPEASQAGFRPGGPSWMLGQGLSARGSLSQTPGSTVPLWTVLFPGPGSWGEGNKNESLTPTLPPHPPPPPRPRDQG